MPAKPSRLSENFYLYKLGNLFGRTPLQINQFLESDAELIQFPGGGVLAITTDCIAEEIATGLYRDPAHIGWMTVAVNLSDLAAVGAQPLGIVLSEILPPHFPDKTLIELQKGIEIACQAMDVHVLGGDTNNAKEWQMGATAVGFIPEGDPVIMRRGASAGDRLFTSGKMGLGGAYSYDQLFSKGRSGIPFYPMPRLTEGSLIRHHGSCCIDTSDGFLHALCNLAEINDLHFQIDIPFEDFLHPLALKIADEHHIPPWIFLAGPHGEFELLFAIPEEKTSDFLQMASDHQWQPICIGRCIDNSSSTFLDQNGQYRDLDIFAIANSWAESDGDPATYLSRLLKIDPL